MSGEWLSGLEEAVRRAADEIAELRRERDELRTTVAELNTKLEAAAEGLPAAGAPATGDETGDSGADEAAWREERREIRRRVEGLTETLEGLLATDD